MKDQKPRYPASLFWSGVAVNILRSILWLVIATVLMLLGSQVLWLGWAGLALVILVIAVALIKQLIYRHILLHPRTPELDDWQAATLSPEWRQNVMTMVQRALNDTEADLYGDEEDGEEDDGEEDDGEEDDGEENQDGDDKE